MNIPDPLPLRNISVPPEVARVDGCTCGGSGDWHRVQTYYDPPDSGCAIFSIPPEEARAAVEAAEDRVQEFTDALNARLREALGSRG